MSIFFFFGIERDFSECFGFRWVSSFLIFWILGGFHLLRYWVSSFLIFLSRIFGVFLVSNFLN